VTGILEKSQPGSPEPEQPVPSSPTTVLAAPLVEETNLENVPLPVYPLPSKPFPVQAPPKIPTGFAPPLPLDKSGKKVRHWRVAQREIRGIAGGRWFARSWAGDRDSEYATFIATKEGEKANGLLPSFKQSSGTSVSAPSAGRGAAKKAKGASSLAASAAPSRDPSVVPQEAGTNTNTSANATLIPIATSTMRAPTKMRIQQLPEDPDPQSDAAMDTDPTPVPDADPIPALPSSEPSALASSSRPEDMS
jgi:Wiskott-Aldrich syndrome protein